MRINTDIVLILRLINVLFKVKISIIPDFCLKLSQEFIIFKLFENIDKVFSMNLLEDKQDSSVGEFDNA